MNIAIMYVMQLQKEQTTYINKFPFWWRIPETGFRDQKSFWDLLQDTSLRDSDMVVIDKYISNGTFDDFVLLYNSDNVCFNRNT